MRRNPYAEVNDLPQLTPAQRMLGIRRAALKIQQDLPDVLGDTVTDVKLTPYEGNRIRSNGGATLKISGPLLIFYVDIVNRNMPMIQHNEHHVDVYIRSVFMNDQGTLAGYVENDGYPSANTILMMLRYMRSLISHSPDPSCLQRDVYFGSLTYLLPDGWHMTRALQAAPPPNSFGLVRVFKIPEDTLYTFNLSFGELGPNDFGFKVNNDLIVRTPDDLDQVFKHEQPAYYFPSHRGLP